MKTIVSFVFLFLISVYHVNSQAKDTVVFFGNKMIRISDSVDHVNVKVSEVRPMGEENYQTVFEGVYTDQQSYERWSVMENFGIQLPLIGNRIKEKRKLKTMQPHWSGYGYGFSAMTDGVEYNNVDGMSLILGRSNEYQINFAEHITPMFFNIFGLTTGLGLNIRKYHFQNSTILTQTNGIVRALDNTPVRYKYNRLSNWYLSIPALLEFQPFKATRHKPYLAAGVIGGVRLSSIYKNKCYNPDGSTTKTSERGMNVLPISIDYAIFAGYGSARLYGKYSPIGLFEKGKGPDVQHTSVGFMLDL